MITEIEQQTLDIDWFFTNGEHIAFVASAGGRLPDSVSQKTFEDLAVLTHYFRNLPRTSESVINPGLHKLIGKGTNKQEYVSDFCKMTEKGLYSFDKMVLNNFLDTSYNLISKPISPLKFKDLPLHIKTIISETITKVNMEEVLNIDLIA